MADKKIVTKSDGSKTVVQGGRIVGNLPGDAAKKAALGVSAPEGYASPLASSQEEGSSSSLARMYEKMMDAVETKATKIQRWANADDVMAVTSESRTIERIKSYRQRAIISLLPTAGFGWRTVEGWENRGPAQNALFVVTTALFAASSFLARKEARKETAEAHERSRKLKEEYERNLAAKRTLSDTEVEEKQRREDLHKALWQTSRP